MKDTFSFVLFCLIRSLECRGTYFFLVLISSGWIQNVQTLRGYPPDEKPEGSARVTALKTALL